MLMTWRWRWRWWWWIALTALTAATESVKAEASDEWCLREVRKGLEGPLVNWTAPNFAVPCGGFTSYLQGATCNNGRIYKLTLTNLSLRGTLSPNIANCTNLQSLDLSHNLIAGSIPSELRFLVNLAVLNLSSNRLSGVIPPEIAMCVYLNVIDLHSNLLSGQIPQTFAVLLRLSALDLSDNRLSGPIPPALSNRSVAGNLPRLNASSFRGNRGLYGYPLPPLRQRGLSVVAIVGIGLGSGFASLVLSFAAVCFWLRVSDRKTSAEEGKITHLMPDY